MAFVLWPLPWPGLGQAAKTGILARGSDLPLWPADANAAPGDAEHNAALVKPMWRIQKACWPR